MGNTKKYTWAWTTMVSRTSRVFTTMPLYALPFGHSSHKMCFASEKNNNKRGKNCYLAVSSITKYRCSVRAHISKIFQPCISLYAMQFLSVMCAYKWVRRHRPDHRRHHCCKCGRNQTKKRRNLKRKVLLSTKALCHSSEWVKNGR